MPWSTTKYGNCITPVIPENRNIEKLATNISINNFALHIDDHYKHTSQSKMFPKTSTNPSIQAAKNDCSSKFDSTISKPILNSKKNCILMQRFSALTDDFDDIDDELQDPLAALSKTKKLCTGNKENESLPLTKSSIPATNVEILQLLEATSDGDHRIKASGQSAVIDSNTLANEEHLIRKQVFHSNIHDMVVQSSSHQGTGSAVLSMAEMCNPQRLLQSLDQSQNETFNKSMNDGNQDVISYNMRNNQSARNTFTNSTKNSKQLANNSVSSNSFHQNILPSSVERTEVGEPSQACKQNLLNNRSIQNPNALCSDGDRVQGCHSNRLARLPPQGGIVPTSHHLWNSQPSPLTNVRPSFPGPAGLLPSLDEAEKNGSLDYMSAALSSYQEQTSKAPVPPSAPSISLGPLWRYMLRDLDIRAADPASPINRHNLERSVVQQQGCGGAGGGGALRRVPLLLVQVSGITPAPGQATLLLHDHTGEVTALLASSAVERWLSLLCCGSALVLTGATVWRRGPGRPAVLTVTADNVAALYTPANKEDGAEVGRGTSSRRSANGTLEVTVTSGLSLEERRQLKDTIGLDTILERSLVEENNDHQAADSWDRSGGSYQGGGGGNVNTTAAAANLAPNRSFPGTLNQNVTRNSGGGGNLNTAVYGANLAPNRSFASNLNLNVSRNNVPNSIRPDFRPGEATPNFVNRPPFNPYRPPINNSRNDGARLNLSSNHNIPKSSPIGFNSSFNSPCSANIAPPSRFRFSPIVPSPAVDSERGLSNPSTNLPPNTTTDYSRSVGGGSHSRGGIFNTPTSRPFGACGRSSTNSDGQSTNVNSTPLRPADAVFNQPSTSSGRFHFKSNIANNAVPRPAGPSAVVNRAVSNPPTTGLISLKQHRNFNVVSNQTNQIRPTIDSIGLRLSSGADSRCVNKVSENTVRHSLPSVSNSKNVVSGTKAAVLGSAVPSERELKEIQDLITNFADGDFDDF